MADTEDENVFDWHRDTQKIINKYQAQPEIYVQHQLESYNNTVENVIPSIINHQNPIQVYGAWDKTTKRFTKLYEINFKEIYMCRPLIRDGHETIKPLYPQEARLRNLTYAGPIFVDIEHKLIDLEDADNPVTKTKQIERKIPLCNFPVMLHSKYCHLHHSEHPDYALLGEGRYDPGGYFIINGGEKVLIPQERPAENKVLCFQRKGEVDIVEVKSTIDQRFNPVNNIQVALGKRKDAESDRILNVSMKYVKQPINLFVVFRALGIENDQDIMQMILGFDPKELNEVDQEAINLLLPTALEVFSDITKDQVTKKITKQKIKITDQIQALKWIAKNMNINETYVESQISRVTDGSEEEKKIARENYLLKYVREILSRDFLPHMGRDYHDKAVFLGYMTNRLINSVLGRRPYDDRDHYANKRLDLAGILLMKIFRENYHKLIRDIKNCITQVLEKNNFNGVDQSLRKIIQNCKIESSLKYALSTGDWSTGKSTSKPSSTTVGIAQVLQRLSYPGMISHLRRLQSPLEKEGGKLVAPRRLHGTQIGRICPNETPEGQQVGVVKNLARTAKITLDTSNGGIYMILKSLNLVPLRKLDLALLPYTIKVFVNGRWVGNARDTQHASVIFKNLVYYKRTRNPDLGVSWNYEYQEISVRSDGGRYLRPLYIVEFDSSKIDQENIEESRPNRLLIEKYWSQVKDMDWKSLVLLGYQGIDKPESGQSLIEYLDVEEEENALVSPMPQTMNRQFENDEFTFLRFTHCEIHPELWMGVVSSIIPFPDHNQSPRNCYQCLEKTTKVLMADNSLKKICDIKIGDKVITVDPDTLQKKPANVINQFVKRTDKNIVKLETVSGQELVCTDDHPILTQNGWKQSGQLTKEDSICVTNDQSTMFVPIEKIHRHENVEIADITIDAETHSFITESGIVVHNSSMGKHAVGVYATNYNNRMDTGGTHVLCYPQLPLVYTKGANALNMDHVPHGQQCMVAVACFTGYNQEDSVIMNQSSVERGRFSSLYFKTRVSKQNKLKASTSEVEKFGLPPDFDQTRDIKSSRRDRKRPFRFIDPETGVVRVGTKFDDLDPEEEVVIIGKYVAVKGNQKQTDKPKYRDISTFIKPMPDSIIDKVIPSPGSVKNIDADGNQFVKVREVALRQPEIGDKFASRSAQKGTVGILYRHADMPMTSDGRVPDLIMNPHAIPSRMTIAQVIECLIGKVAVKQGKFVDSTAFTNPAPNEYDKNEPMKYYTKILEEYGFHPQGEEVMFNPQTGEQFESTIFFGPTYYQRLKHMVIDKVHSREVGPVKTSTRQPSDGRARDGGFRLGEMERDVLISHGASQFLKERLVDSSDIFRVFVGKEAQTIVVGNPDKGIYRYDNNELNPDEVVEVQMPYAMKLFYQELTAMGIDLRLKVDE